tara:strand:+ start:1112 stop:1933 length:822 start_codon:yes stop_codon:yes gene_type:complete
MKLKERIVIKIGENLRGNGFFQRNFRKIIFSLMHGINGFEFSYFSDRNGEHELLDNQIGKNNSDLKHIVFDGGSNRGDYCNEIVSRFNKKQIENYEVHLFDIDIEMIEICKKRFMNNKRIFINNLGLDKVSDDRKAIFYPDDSTRNSLEGTPIEVDWLYYEKKIKTITGNEYCKSNNINYINFMKLDLEGYDLDSLNGFVDLLSNKSIRFIQFEYTHRALDRRILLRDFYDFFKKYGYQIGFIRKDGLKPITKFYPQYNNWKLGPNFYAQPID